MRGIRSQPRWTEQDRKQTADMADRYVASRGNRPAFNESMKRIASWDFDTIIPCHGETIIGNGKEVFKRVFEWHLEAKDGTQAKV
jgi:hypothetical protein